MSNKGKTGVFSDFEKEAMRNRAKELAAEAKLTRTKAEGVKDVQDAIAKLVEPDRTMATRIHTLITENAPELAPKTWYGMPAYADKDGKAVCFFQPADKFKARYSTLGFNDNAKLDEGSTWATAYALLKLTKTEEAKIIELVRKSIS